MITVQEIITLFESLTDDSTEFATTQEILYINKALRKIAQERDWNFLKRRYVGTTDSNGYLTLPTDFRNVAKNFAQDPTIPRDDTAIVYLGENKTVYPLIPIGLVDQSNKGTTYPYLSNNYLQYWNLPNQFAYIDYANNRLVVNGTQGANNQVIFDYIANIGTVATVNDNIPLPNDFAEIIAYALLIDDVLVQKIDALKNLLPENKQTYKEYLQNLRRWDNSFFVY